MTNFRLIGCLVIAFCWMQLAIPRIAAACPTCKNGLHDDGTAAAYAISILFMMSMPFVILLCWFIAIVRLRANVPVSSIDLKPDLFDLPKPLTTN